MSQSGGTADSTNLCPATNRLGLGVFQLVGGVDQFTYNHDAVFRYGTDSTIPHLETHHSSICTVEPGFDHPDHFTREVRLVELELLVGEAKSAVREVEEIRRSPRLAEDLGRNTADAAGVRCPSRSTALSGEPFQIRLDPLEFC